MSLNKLSIIWLFAALLSVPCAFSAESKDKPAEVAKPAAKKEEAAKPRKELARADKIEAIKSNLSSFEEIANLVQGLKKETDASGNVVYTFQGAKIENLSDDLLDKLFSRVSSEAVRFRTERLNRQLQTIKRANDLTRMNRQITTVPKVQRTYAPPYRAPVAPVINQVRQPVIPKPAPKAPPSTNTYSTRRY